MQAHIDKWRRIVQDYEANVTHIRGRELFHMLHDVVTHSVLQFKFQGRLVTRGWVEALIVGDTRTGKSEVATRLQQHLGLSKPIDCERASRAGVVGGIDKLGDRFAVTWGALPRQDRRMAVLDEVTGLREEDISSMSGMRSSGVAQITMIHTAETMARVRKLWLANPRTERNRKMNTYAYGVQVVPEVIGRAEDIARFDIATGASSEDVPLSMLHQKMEDVPHVYTSAAAHALVMWAWTRTPEQVVFEPGVEDRCMALAETQCHDFSSAIPLVEPGEQRIRVARLAVAISSRFHSTTDGTHLSVGEVHADLADWLLRQCYSTPAFAYDRFSKRSGKEAVGIEEAEALKINEYFGTYAHPESLIEAVSENAIRQVLGQQIGEFQGALRDMGLLRLGEKGIQPTAKWTQFVLWRERQ